MDDLSPRSWREGLPVLVGVRVQLREPVIADASALFDELCTPEVCEFVPPPPATVEGVEFTVGRGIEWRRSGRGFCFAIEVIGTGQVIGLVQFLGSRTASAVPVSTHVPWEWGFAVGAAHWGTGLFHEAASMALKFAFDVVGVRQVDGWVLQTNRRANLALAKLDAEPHVRPHVQAPDGRVGDFVQWIHRRTP